MRIEMFQFQKKSRRWYLELSWEGTAPPGIILACGRENYCPLKKTWRDDLKWRPQRRWRDDSKE